MLVVHGFERGGVGSRLGVIPAINGAGISAWFIYGRAKKSDVLVVTRFGDSYEELVTKKQEAVAIRDPFSQEISRDEMLKHGFILVLRGGGFDLYVARKLISARRMHPVFEGWET